ncbi:S24 family peptidase [Pseudomonas sp.]|uniref:LexA family transcriptional regulator n=1 Tax=Pseudomonas sp. TaxID=306 RepID=UPI003267B185
MSKKPLPQDKKDECLRLKAIFNSKKSELGLTQEKLAHALEMNQSSVSHYLNGVNPLNASVAASFAKILQVDVSEFSERLAGEMEKIAQAVDREPRELSSPSEKDYALIPQFRARGACGDGYLNEHVQLTEGLVFKRDWLKRMNAKPENLFVMYADGDSMEPYIFEGDVVLFDTSKTEPRDKQVYVIRRPDGGNSIKRLIQQLSGTWVIRSDSSDKAENPDELASEDSIHGMPILGRVIWRGGGVG